MEIGLVLEGGLALLLFLLLHPSCLVMQSLLVGLDLEAYLAEAVVAAEIRQ